MQTKTTHRIRSKQTDDTQMSEYEFYTQIDKSIAQIERGECVKMEKGQSVKEFINSL